VGIVFAPVNLNEPSGHVGLTTATARTVIMIFLDLPVVEIIILVLEELPSQLLLRYSEIHYLVTLPCTLQ
jgi:hypothetical protein